MEVVQFQIVGGTLYRLHEDGTIKTVKPIPVEPLPGQLGIVEELDKLRERPGDTGHPPDRM